ncbi:hypothetical protein ACHHYP_10071 [Achlya hypogyna]|uniref:BZIP domain-containing protein n=1 Tax=Achlya hypogyna TaxID=1202772 RepID=A0A1V9ZII0_ACHHY|nr:hypothetical protein ACHHYP_10071 [Achlya hypogyna]
MGNYSRATVPKLPLFMEAFEDDDQPHATSGSPAGSSDDDDGSHKRRKKDHDDDHGSGGDHRKLKNREAAALSRRRNKDRMETLQRRVFDMESMNTRLRALVDELQWKMVSHGLEHEVHECHAQAGIIVNGTHVALQSPRRKPQEVSREKQSPMASFPSAHMGPSMRPQFPSGEQRRFASPFPAQSFMHPPLIPPRESRQEIQMESHVSALLGLQFSQPTAKPEPPPPSSYPPFPYPQYDQQGYLPYRAT